GGRPTGQANIFTTSPEVTGWPLWLDGLCPPMPATGVTLTCVALARRAPTVQLSRPRLAKGSKRNSRIALRWVALSISSLGRCLVALHTVSGDFGQTQSECG